MKNKQTMEETASKPPTSRLEKQEIPFWATPSSQPIIPITNDDLQKPCWKPVLPHILYLIPRKYKEKNEVYFLFYCHLDSLQMHTHRIAYSQVPATVNEQQKK